MRLGSLYFKHFYGIYFIQTDIEVEPRSHSQLAQAATQTSPDTYADGALAQMFLGSYNVDVEIEVHESHYTNVQIKIVDSLE